MSDTNVVKNVSAGKPNPDGAIYRAPFGTTLPTNATSTLGAAFEPLGFISEDGMVNSKSLETENIKSWGGVVVLTTQTDRNDTFQFTMLEILNPAVLKTVHGDSNVTGALATGITVRTNATELPAAVYVIELALREGAKKRIVIPNGKITELGDVTYVDNDAVGYQVTLSANAGGFDGDNDTYKEYIVRATST